MKQPIEITFKFFDEEYKARFWCDTYMNNGNLYVGVITWSEDYDGWEPWGDLTVNLPGMFCEPKQAFLDTNNCAPEIIMTLEKAKLIKNTGITRQSGYYTYPLYEFSEEFLNGMFEEEL